MQLQWHRREMLLFQGCTGFPTDHRTLYSMTAGDLACCLDVTAIIITRHLNIHVGLFLRIRILEKIVQTQKAKAQLMSENVLLRHAVYDWCMISARSLKHQGSRRSTRVPERSRQLLQPLRACEIRPRPDQDRTQEGCRGLIDVLGRGKSKKGGAKGKT